MAKSTFTKIKGGGVNVKSKGGLKFHGGPKQASPKLQTNAPTASQVTPQPTTQPFLTPDQATAKALADYNFDAKIRGFNAALATATANTNLKMAQNVHNSAVSKQTAQAMNAARGVFNSSINANDLSDIATKLTLANNTLITNLGTLQSAIQGNIHDVQVNRWITDAGYNANAVANAQQTPVGPTAPAPWNTAATSTTNPTPNPNASTGGQPPQTPKAANPNPNPNPNPKIGKLAYIKAGRLGQGTPGNRVRAGGLSTPNINVNIHPASAMGAW